ncbi:hypothetical protein D3C79_964610 [compost metagenome]
MMNVIQYLEQNPALVTLLKEQKASLIGISTMEQKAILDSFEEDLCVQSGLWN